MFDMEKYFQLLADLFDVAGQAAGEIQETVENATAAVTRLILEYQGIYGLVEDGRIGRITARHLDRPRFCSVKEAFRTGPPCMIKGVTEIPVVLGVAPLGSAKSLQDAIDDINANCGLTLFRHDRFVGPAHIDIMVGVLDGQPGGTLAVSDLPCGGHTKIKQTYDQEEAWHTAAGPPSWGRISLPAVMRHELLHGLGVRHQAGGIMEPVYNPEVITLQPSDVKSLQDRYGPPKAQPNPVDNHVPQEIRLQIGGAAYFGEVVRSNG